MEEGGCRVEYIRIKGKFRVEEDEGGEDHQVKITSLETEHKSPFEEIIYKHRSTTGYILRTAPEGCLGFNGREIFLKPGQFTRGDNSCKAI